MTLYLIEEIKLLQFQRSVDVVLLKGVIVIPIETDKTGLGNEV